MKKLTRKLLSILTAGALALTAVTLPEAGLILPGLTAPVSAADIGENLSWSLTENTSAAGTYTLTISGEGAMVNFTAEFRPAWDEIADRITTIIADEGVTSIGDYAFGSCGEAVSVSLPSTLESIGAYAFKDCAKIEELEIYSAVKSISSTAFSGWTGLAYVKYHGSSATWASFNIPADSFSEIFCINDDWDALSGMLEAGGTVRLTQDCIADSGNYELYVPKGVTTVLDLNGHTIDFTNASAESHHAVSVEGTLTIMDTSSDKKGVIIGGKAAGNSHIGVYAAGTLILQSGRISGCASADEVGAGGGVYVDKGGVFTMEGGMIDNCTASNGGGVYICGGGTFEMSGGGIGDCTAKENGAGVYVECTAAGGAGEFILSGSGEITTNKVGSDLNNIYLCEGTAIEIAEGFGHGVFGITTEGGAGTVIARGANNAECTIDNFAAFCDTEDYAVGVDSDGNFFYIGTEFTEPLVTADIVYDGKDHVSDSFVIKDKDGNALSSDCYEILGFEKKYDSGYYFGSYKVQDVGDYRVMILGKGEYAGEYYVYFSVTPATVTVTADAKEKTYGETDPELTYTVSGLVGTDTLTGALTREAGENVGEYNITQGTLTAGDNYTITFTGAKLRITKAAFDDVDLSFSMLFGCGTDMPLTNWICPGGTPGNASVTSGSTLFTTAPFVSEGSLIFALKKDKTLVGQSAVITIPVTSGNYSDYTVTMTWTVAACPHESTTLTGAKDATCFEDGYTGDYVCDFCGDTVTGGTKINKLPHTPGEAVKENSVDPTCTAAGSYDMVTYCTVCLQKTGSTHYDTEKLGHLPLEAVRENVTDEGCTTDGSYDEVVYCGRCEAELSRTPKTIPAHGHHFVDGICEYCGVSSLKAIQVTPPVKYAYLIGEALDLTGAQLLVTNGDDTQEIIAVTEDMVSGFDSSTAGTKTLTVKYSGLEATFTVIVEQKPELTKQVKTLKIVQTPNKTDYIAGEPLDLTGGKLRVIYTDNTEEFIDMAYHMVSGFNTYKTGNQKLTVKYDKKTATFTVTVNPDPDEMPVVVNGKGYKTLTEAIKENTRGALDITIRKTVYEKSLSLPKTVTSAKITTAPGAVLTFTTPSITVACDLVLDAAIAAENEKAKTLKLKTIADKTITITRCDCTIPLTPDGAKTTVYRLDTGTTIGITAASGVKIDIAKGTTVRLDAGKFAPETLTGEGKLDIYGKSNVTLTNVTSADITLNKYTTTSGKTTTVELQKLTLGTFGNMTLTVREPDGKLSNISGKTVLSLSKKDEIENIEDKIRFTNTANGKPLNAVQYAKSVRAEFTGALTVSDGTDPKDFGSFDKAFAAMTNASGNYTLTLNEDISPETFALPKTLGSLTVEGNGNTLILTGVSALTPKYSLSLKNISITALTNKGAEGALTLNLKTGDAEIDGLTFTGTALSVKGGKDNRLTLGECSEITTLSGFGSISVTDTTTIAKTFSANNVTLEEDAELKLLNGSLLTINKKFVMTGMEGSKITLCEGFKPIVLNGDISGSIRLESDITLEDQPIIKTTADLSGKLDVSGIAPDNELTYDLITKNGSAYLKAYTFELDGKKYAYWSDAIDQIKDNTKDYTITLIADVDIGAAMKLPAAAKCGSLTINGNGHKLTFVGKSVSVSAPLTLKDITITALRLNSITKVYEPTEWVLAAYDKLTKEGSVVLVNCAEK